MELTTCYFYPEISQLKVFPYSFISSDDWGCAAVMLFSSPKVSFSFSSAESFFGLEWGARRKLILLVGIFLQYFVVLSGQG